MVIPLLVKVGKLTGDERYFDMAVRHLDFTQNLLLRNDNLYRHSPLADVAWGRGNAFPALGLALSLSDIPESHPTYDQFETAFVQHMEALRPFQDIDGMWHEVIDFRGSFAEITATAMIGIAIKRGLDLDLLPAEIFQPMLNNTWDAVSLRTSLTGEFVNACTSTGKLTSLDAYLDRLAILGRDDRAGGMVMNFANEMAGY
jgi:rhamnogalacturonyl hydrolase YesR